MVSYHKVKAFDHAIFTIFLALSNQSDGTLNSDLITSLQKLNADMKTAKKAIPTFGFSTEEKNVTQFVADSINNYLDKLLTSKQFVRTDLKRFHAKVMPALNTIIHIAAHAEINALDHAITPWLAKLTDEEKARIGIVVATVHQARAEELSIQYFAKKFNKQMGEGAKTEDGLVVLEGKFDEASALLLLARHYLDRDFSAVMFDDPARFQRDALGDAAKAELTRIF